MMLVLQWPAHPMLRSDRDGLSLAPAAAGLPNGGPPRRCSSSTLPLPPPSPPDTIIATEQQGVYQVQGNVRANSLVTAFNLDNGLTFGQRHGRGRPLRLPGARDRGRSHGALVLDRHRREQRSELRAQAEVTGLRRDVTTAARLGQRCRQHRRRAKRRTPGRLRASARKRPALDSERLRAAPCDRRARGGGGGFGDGLAAGSTPCSCTSPTRS